MKITKKHRAHAASMMNVDVTFENGTTLTQWKDLPGWVYYPTEGGSFLVLHRHAGGGWWLKEIEDDMEVWGPDVAGPFPCRKHALAAWKILTN